MKLLDLFSGIGGFHKGFEQAGFKFDWVGHSDIDKYANKLYQDRFKAEELGDVTAIQPRRLPNDITIVCGGFPCQAFSMAGKRKGFDDTRGTLFFEIARILRYFKELGKTIPYFVLENVKGLLNHDSGRTFATIYRVLTDLDYTVECQLLNTKWFLPQNRERIYIVGHLRGRSGSKIFPITKSYRENGYVSENHKTGLYKVKEATKKGYAFAGEGDSINLSVPKSKTRRGRVGKGVAQTLDPGMQQYTIQSGIRRLTPLECERLQGFPDNWTNNGQSDTQRYKQLGNAVSVPVVQAIAEKIKKLL